jgi:hypothetical protein
MSVFIEALRDQVTDNGQPRRVSKLELVLGQFASSKLTVPIQTSQSSFW